MEVAGTKETGAKAGYMKTVTYVRRKSQQKKNEEIKRGAS